MYPDHLLQGQLAEKKAFRFLKAHGLKKIENNYRCRAGEIDLIMQDKDIIVFVEVRYRKNTRYAQGLETITPLKQQRIIKTAWHFLQRRRQFQRSRCRFDVISIENRGRITWIKNAFTVQ